MLAFIYGPLMVMQLVLFFFFYYNHYGLAYLLYPGWVLWALSAIFGVGPIIEFRRKGGVKKGKSYIETTKLVDTGLYSIVRHPQYLSGLLITTALAMLTQHWLSVLAAALVLPTFYYDTTRADRDAKKKFGNQYRDYMKRVPRTNFILGIARAITRRMREKGR